MASALTQLEAETGAAIAASVDPATLDRWRTSVAELRPDGQTQQSWLWSAPAKHSTRQISEVLGRSEEHTSELQSPCNLVCRLLLEKKKRHSIHESCPDTHRLNRMRNLQDSIQLPIVTCSMDDNYLLHMSSRVL